VFWHFAISAASLFSGRAFCFSFPLSGGPEAIRANPPSRAGGLLGRSCELGLYCLVFLPPQWRSRLEAAATGQTT